MADSTTNTQELRRQIARDRDLAEYYAEFRRGLNGLPHVALAIDSGKFEMDSGTASKVSGALSDVGEAVPVVGPALKLVFAGIGFLAARGHQAKMEADFANVAKTLPSLDTNEWNQFTKTLATQVLASKGKGLEIKRTAAGKPDSTTDFFTAAFSGKKSDVASLAIRDAAEVAARILSGEISVDHPLGVEDEETRDSVVSDLSSGLVRPTPTTAKFSATQLAPPKQHGVEAGA